MNIIRRHKGLSLVLGLTLILVIILFIICGKMIFTTGDTVYGDRLNGKVSVSNSVTSSIIDEISKYDEVVDIKIRIQGKIIYTTIKYKEGTNVNKAKEIADSTLSKYDEDVLGYYDLAYFLKEEVTKDENSEEEKKGFMLVGQKHPDFEKISYAKS